MEGVLKEICRRFREDCFKHIARGRSEAILILLALVLGVILSFLFILEPYTGMLRDIILLSQRMVGLLPLETISENEDLYQMIQNRVS